MKVLVIGFGSIGSRHARILTELGCEVAVVSRRRIDWKPSFFDIASAVKCFEPEYAVIANRTREHYQSLVALKAAGFKGVVMVEKPLFAGQARFPVGCFKKVVVGYNLRFHPLIRSLRDQFKGRVILSAQTYVGKDLRTWRKGVDYRKSYSASRKQGGGVLRDLSHELDYMNWILGGWTAVAASGGHCSRLRIQSDDVYCLMLKTRRCANVLIQMNYIDKPGSRAMIFNSDDRTVKVDLIGQWIEINGRKRVVKVPRDQTYRDQHNAVLKKKWNILCSYREAADIMRLIHAAEKASRAQKWVKR